MKLSARRGGGDALFSHAAERAPFLRTAGLLSLSCARALALALSLSRAAQMSLCLQSRSICISHTSFFRFRFVRTVSASLWTCELCCEKDKAARTCILDKFGKLLGTRCSSRRNNTSFLICLTFSAALGLNSSVLGCTC